MKKNHLNSRQLQIAMAAGLVAVFAGCQVAPVTKAPIEEGSVGSSKSQPGKTTTVTTPGQTNTATGSTGTGNTAVQPGTPTMAAVTPDAKVSGTVLDVDGKPIAGMTVNTYNGFKAVTDERGHFTIDVKAQDELRLDLSKPGFLNRQVNVSLATGEIGNVSLAMKPLDAKVTKISAANGGTAISADGKSQLIIPAGALTKDGDVRLTWMDPMPSDKFPTSFGELPGPLVTRTLPSGENAGDEEQVTIPPIAFTNVEWAETQLAPGAQATLRMKVNPEALRLAGDNIDFNNPATLQQPCYDFDRASGLWVNPATSKLEKDADGTVWFVYTLRGKEAPKNFFSLLQTVTTGNYVTGQQLVTWQEQQTYQVYVDNPGGGGSWVTRTRTVTRSRYDDLFGKEFTGKVTEKSANAALNNQPLANAVVRHQQDFYGRTTKTTNGAGSFTIPMWHNTNSVSVTGANFFNAASQNGGFDINLNTNSHVVLTPGGDFTSAHANEKFKIVYKIDGVEKTEENVTFSPTGNWDFGRDASDNMNSWELVSAASENFVFVATPAAPILKSDLRPGDTGRHTLNLLFAGQK